MNKAELISAIAQEAELTKVQAQNALEAALGAIEAAIKAGDSVTLIGFGSFAVSERQARKGINPQTKKPITIPAAKVVKFRPGKNLKDAAAKPAKKAAKKRK